MGGLLDDRRRETSRRIAQLQKKLKHSGALCRGRACVYAIGSFGRREASRYSDLDLFIVGEQEDGERSLPRLDEILVKADLIGSTRSLRIPDFSGDGEYLTHYTVDELIGTLGKPEDDIRNTFTARLLLLLEGYPLLERRVYERVIQKVIRAYWRDYNGHEENFIPTFLANDILRLWRTFCVNYEARTRIEPPEQKAKRKLKNYKLKHSRLLTCYSALTYLLACFTENRSVRPEDAIKMTRLTPTGRLEWLLSQRRLRGVHQDVSELLAQYERFLKSTDKSEGMLIRIFLDKKKGGEYVAIGNRLGDLVFRILEGIGSGSGFHRQLLV